MTTQDVQSLGLIVAPLVPGQFVAVVGAHGIARISDKAISMRDRLAPSK